MTGNGTVFRDQTINKYVTHPHRLQPTWTVPARSSLYTLSRRQSLPGLEFPSFSPLYGGSGRLQQSVGTGLGKLQPLEKRLIESRSTGYFGV